MTQLDDLLVLLADGGTTLGTLSYIGDRLIV